MQEVTPPELKEDFRKFKRLFSERYDFNYRNATVSRVEEDSTEQQLLLNHIIRWLDRNQASKLTDATNAQIGREELQEVSEQMGTADVKRLSTIVASEDAHNDDGTRFWLL